ncbi:DUF5643 domain-containing protein [Paenibacillus sp. Marseille-Q7038]
MNIPVKKNSEDTVDISPHVTKTEGIYTVTLKRVELSPITTNISTHIVLPEGVKYDPLTMNIEYEVLDDKGNDLRSITGNAHYERNGTEVTEDLRLEPFSSVPSKIIIKPYQSKRSETEEGLFKYDEEGNIMKTIFLNLSSKWI